MDDFFERLQAERKRDAEKAKRYRERHPEKARQASLASYHANIERNRERAAERARKRRALMPEADRAYQRKWRKDNPDKVKAHVSESQSRAYCKAATDICPQEKVRSFI